MGRRSGGKLVPVKNSLKTGRTRFKPGQSGNPRGRPKGAKSRVTIEAQKACAAIVDDPVYRAKLLAAARARTLPPGVEVLLWHYAKGKPKDEVSVDMVSTAVIDLEQIDSLTTEELEQARTWHRKLLGRS